MNRNNTLLFSDAPVSKAVLSLLRKGSIDVVFMVLFNHLFGLGGIAWATPAADGIAFGISLLLIVPFLKKLNSSK